MSEGEREREREREGERGRVRERKRERRKTMPPFYDTQTERLCLALWLFLSLGKKPLAFGHKKKNPSKLIITKTHSDESQD